MENRSPIVSGTCKPIICSTLLTSHFCEYVSRRRPMLPVYSLCQISSILFGAARIKVRIHHPGFARVTNQLFRTSLIDSFHVHSIFRSSYLVYSQSKCSSVQFVDSNGSSRVSHIKFRSAKCSSLEKAQLRGCLPDAARCSNACGRTLFMLVRYVNDHR